MSYLTLMTYPDSMGGDLKKLKIILDKYFNHFDGVHILPPYISTADRGFCPVTHLEIESSFGTYEDIKNISNDYILELDLVAGHISDKSPQFLDYLEKGEGSQYSDLFLKFSDVFRDGIISNSQIIDFTKLTSIPPFIVHTLKDKSRVLHFNTFTPNQIDLNINSPLTWDLLNSYIDKLIENGVKIIRLDAIQTFTKSSDKKFMGFDQAKKLVSKINDIVSDRGVQVLPEIMWSEIEDMAEMEKLGVISYDFGFISLFMHAVYNQNCNKLVDWLNVKFDKFKSAITVLTNHDGINPFISNEFLDHEDQSRVDCMIKHRNSEVVAKTTGTKANNVSSRNINISLLEMCMNNSKLWMLAHVLTLFSPGNPQLYYHDIFQSSSNMQNLLMTGEGRSVIRNNYLVCDIEDIFRNNDSVKNLFKLIKLRQTKYKNIIDSGSFESIYISPTQMILRWTLENKILSIFVDFNLYDYTIKYE